MASFFGYPGLVWECCYNAIAWLEGNLSGADPITLVAQIEAVYVTLRNAGYSVQAWSTLNALQGEYVLLQEIQSLSLSLSSNGQTFLANRLAAVEAFIQDLPNYTPAVAPIQAASLVASGQVAVPYSGFIEGLMSANYEGYPYFFTSAANYAYALRQQIAGWTEIMGAVQTVQGNLLTGAYDAAARMLAVSQQCYNDYMGMQSIPYDQTLTPGASDLSTLWNQTIAIPGMLTLASLLYSPPSTTINQECGTVRYVLSGIADQLALLILALRRPAATAVSSAQVRSGDSLMDVAARNLGDFEQWSAIAELNGLQQPWVAPLPSEGVAQYGSTVLLPQPGSTGQPSGYPIPSYSVNVLGTDIYLGPLNQPMTAWTGDFQTISGYSNLQISLGRRLVTTLGDLIYHPDFGSRIPPEVGAVQDQYSLLRIAAYAESALLTDGRVAAIVSATCSAPAGANGTVNFTGTVQPIGFGAQVTAVNQTLSPPPIGAS